MKIILVGYESITHRNSNLYQISMGLNKIEWLDKVICMKKNKNIEINEKIITQEPWILYLMHVLLSFSWNNIDRRIPERFYNESIFDLFSQTYIDKCKDVLLCTDSGLIRTIRKAKAKNIHTIVLHRTLHPVTIYNILSEENYKFKLDDHSAFTNKKWVELRTSCLKECDTVFVLSSLAKESCVTQGIPEEKIKVVTHGKAVDVKYFNSDKSKSTEDMFTCLFVGHKSLIKGVHYLLEAWRLLKSDKAFDGELIICGIQNMKLINMYKEILKFKAIGPVDDPRSLYQKSSIFVLPALAEGFGRVVLEAMACGLPVIITDGVGAKDIVDDGIDGFIIPIRDPIAIAEKIKYFYDNPSEIIRMGKNARRKAEYHSGVRMGKEIVNLLKELRV